MTHRFYTGNTKDKSGVLDLGHDIWINDQPLANQILKVLRMRVGEELVLFDGNGTEILYRITEIEPFALRLSKVTDLDPGEPKRKIILAWSLLKKDKNDWVLQKCTELGVAHFLPVIADRTEKTGFDIERAQKIIIEAVEQCGRHTIPKVNEPQKISDIIGQYKDHMPICVTDMAGDVFVDDGAAEILVLVGPEGGWSDKERKVFADFKIAHISISNFTLRAETASVSAVSIIGGFNS
jgi:16S rRNA (uracil1498-N3)-methyltransferase